MSAVTKRIEPWAVLLFPLYVFVVTHVRPIVQNVWPSDLFLIADAGARILEGLRPHADYFSALGVLTQAVVAAGLWFTDLNVTGVFAAAEAFALLSAAWLYLRGRRLGVPWYLAFAMGVLAIEFVVPLRPLGYRSTMITTMGLYNRIGWVFLAAIFLEVNQALAAPPRRSSSIVVGVLLSLLLATKINIFGAGVSARAAFDLGGAGPVAKGRGRRGGGGRGHGDLGAGLPNTAGRVLTDTITVVTSMPWAQKFDLLWTLARGNAREFAFDLFFLAVWVGPAWRAGRRRRILAGLGLYASTIVASLATGVGSIARDEFLLSFLTPLIALVFAPPGVRRNLTVGAMIAFLAWPTVRMNLESYAVRRAQRMRLGTPDLYQTIHSPRAAGVYFATWPNQIGADRIAAVAVARTDESSPAGFAMQVSAALGLLGSNVPADAKLLTLMGEQWMTYLAGLRHVPGDYLFYQVNRVNVRPFPNDVPRVVEAADLVLTPKTLNDPRFYGNEFYVREEYQPYVHRGFEVARENAYWTLWTKRPGPAR